MTDFDYFEFDCMCQQDTCRGLVRGFRHLPQTKKLEYKGHFSSYLERMFTIEMLRQSEEKREPI